MLGDPPVQFRLWNGEIVRGTSSEVVATVGVADRATAMGILRDPHVRVGDAYCDGRLEIEGDLVRFVESVYAANERAGGIRPVGVQKIAGWLRKPRSNTLAGSRENIHHHYDIGNDFYSLWLGSTMAYTCAYYPTPDATLDEAQVAKMHHVCRKLRLQPGETVVEAGCGWGMLAIHMAKHYGVKVRAFNISKEQIAYARELAKREGLAGQVEYVEDDYRNITGTYDAFISVGMLEHVGADNYPELGRVISKCLPANGRGLIHSIGRNTPGRLHPWIDKRIFPGAHPPALSEISQIFEPFQLSVLDIENIRLHYARTLTQWLALYEAAADKVRAMFDERFVRMWRLYLAGSIAAFNCGELQLFQVVFAPKHNNAVPWTRAHLYAT
jgi:cyclopropane-fatty-acyl-phospholipid synthase